MINFSTVQPGMTLRIPFASYAGSTGASITLTGLAVTDIEVYKDGSTTQRASDSGYALLDTDGIDFDGITGIHGFSIDLADNSTAGFYAAGSDYLVVVSAVTIDSQTVNFVAATFRIGYPDAVLNTTIATLSSQTSFTLTNGPAEDDALNGCEIVIHDVASAVQVGRAVVLDYTGSTRTVTLAAATTFTIAAGDNVAVLGLAPLQPTVTGRTLDVTATGAGGVDWGNVENAGTTVGLSGTTVATVTTTGTATNLTNLPAITANWLTAAGLATDAVQEIRDAITGGAYALSTDANGRVRIVDGTGAGELDTASGKVSIVAGDITSIQSGLATAAALATLDDFVDTEVAAIKAVTDKLDTALEADGAVGYQFTTLALENGPSGGGGGTDWTADERTAIRSILGVPGSGTTPADPSAGILDTIRDYLDTEISTILSRIGVPASSIAADIAALNDITAAEVWAAGTRTLTAGANIVLAKGTGVTGFNDLSAAEVNAEVVDALATDTYAEPSGVPAATATLAAKVNRLYAALVAPLDVTASAKTFKNQAGSAQWKKALSDDGTTYSEAAASAP